MYTSKEAQKLVDYYSDKVIGKPISEKLQEKLIETLGVVEISNQKFNVYCYNNSNRPPTYSHIIAVAENLNLLSPSEVLE